MWESSQDLLHWFQQSKLAATGIEISKDLSYYNPLSSSDLSHSHLDTDSYKNRRLASLPEVHLSFHLLSIKILSGNSHPFCTIVWNTTMAQTHLCAGESAEQLQVVFPFPEPPGPVNLSKTNTITPIISMVIMREQQEWFPSTFTTQVPHRMGLQTQRPPMLLKASQGQRREAAL